MMKNVLSGFMAAVMSLLAMAFATATLPAEGASVSTYPEAVSAKKNQEFSVSIEIASAADLYGYQLEAVYTSKSCELIRVEEGPFLNKSGNERTLFLKPIQDVNAESVTIAGIKIGPAAGTDGSGTLVRLTFRAKKNINKKTVLWIVNDGVRLLDSSGRNME